MSLEKWYHHDTQEGFLAFVNAINVNPILPVRGEIDGHLAPDSYQKTTCYMNPGQEREYIAGGWGGPKIPDSVLDYAKVPPATREQMMEDYNITVREIDPSTDLVPLPEPDPPEQE